jgi:hypothetical protein
MSLSNAFPSVTPSLNLNFIRNNRLDPRITYSRSTTATYVGSDGYIKTAVTDEPRFEYDSVSLAPRGLLLEGPRTNLVLYSEDFSNADWTKVDTNVTTNITAAPSNSLTADMIVAAATSAQHQVRKAITLGTSKTYTFSVFAKQASGVYDLVLAFGANVSGSWDANARASVRFNLLTGVVAATTQNGNSSHISSSITPAGNGWYRCVWTFIPDTTGATAVFGPGMMAIPSGEFAAIPWTGDGTSGVYVWGAQLEEAYFSSSYIQTTSAEVTRAADDMEITGSNFTPWYNQSGGAFVISSDTFKADNTANTTNSRIFNLSDGTNDSRYTLLYNTDGGVSMSAAAAAFSASDSDSGVASKTVQKVGVNIEAGNSFLTHNGVQVGSTDTGAIVLNYMNRFDIFRLQTSSDPETSYGWGHIQYLLYYPEPLTVAQLRTLTK